MLTLAFNVSHIPGVICVESSAAKKNIPWQEIAPDLARLGDQMDEVIDIAGALRQQAINMSEHYSLE